ncbi:DUF624 domain-containing protein [Halobacillus salinarum]|uniref:DUF624 domain-containing protein n=1 Tax=Halobacillus salinarum TaxID=2932257 RepID=A0ABY4EK29_9BACI|nr:DUF624 domain-containing protein [Halobacillus salinarum]UOQ44826.1 DUF624 domain-containing protein [Halobacillus salinarum]
MLSYSGIFGFIHFLSSWFMRFAVTNLLWAAVNLPIAFILVSSFANTGTVSEASYLPLFILLPLLFFPSTTALFGMVRDWMMDEEHSSLMRNYFSHLKKNYKMSMGAGWIWTVIWAVWLVDFRYFSELNDLAGFVMRIAGVLLVVMNVHFLSLSVHYHMNIFARLKNSALLTVGRPLLTLGTAAVCVCAVYASFSIWFLFLFFTGSVTACVSFYLFYKTSLKMKAKAEEAHA